MARKNATLKKEAPPPAPTADEQRQTAQRAAFLAVFRDHGNVRLACSAAGINRSTAYRWREQDATFAKGWADALEDACDVLEAEAVNRARKTSDTLLIFLLKAHRPAVYRETTRTEHTGKDGGPIETATSFAALSDAALDELITQLRGRVHAGE